MAYDNQNVGHCMSYLCLSVVVPGFDSIDEKQQNAKLSAMSDKVTEWLRLINYDVNEDGVIDYKDAVEIIFDHVMPYILEQDSDAITMDVYRACALLMSINEWQEAASRELLGGIVEVAVADGQVTQSEINTINAIATGLAVVDNEEVIKSLNILKEIVVDP